MSVPRLSAQRPDPTRLWVRYSLRPWPGPAGFWTHLAEAGVGQDERAVSIELPAVEELDDVFYVPPVSAEMSVGRSRLLRSLAGRNTPVLLQLMPGEEEPEVGAGKIVYDLLPALVAGDMGALAELPADSNVIWPLVAGLTDLPATVEAGLDRLATAGVGHVRGLALVLQPAIRRRLAELGGEAVFDRLFHGPPPAERLFAIRAAAVGLKPFVERPLPSDSPALAHNRWLAGELAIIGELWLRIERSESRGQAFFRAARLIDEADRDIQVLCSEGNLGVLPWLDPPSREVIAELVADGRSSLREELEVEYLS
ncbi:MAG: hypothetical protein WBG93_15235 [Thermoanaerobaculia bacterium]